MEAFSGVASHDLSLDDQRLSRDDEDLSSDDEDLSSDDEDLLVGEEVLLAIKAVLKDIAAGIEEGLREGLPQIGRDNPNINLNWSQAKNELLRGFDPFWHVAVVGVGMTGIIALSVVAVLNDVELHSFAGYLSCLTFLASLGVIRAGISDLDSIESTKADGDALKDESQA